MEYLIWGAGKRTQIFIDTYYACYFYDNPIRAIIDNDESKWGIYFGGFPVISPQNMYKYSFDKILLCSHYETIKSQISEEFKIGIDKIITKEELLEQINNKLRYQWKILGKRGLVVGDRKTYSLIEGYYTQLFNVVGVIDYNDLETLEGYFFDYIILMDLMHIPEITNTGITKRMAEELLIEKLVEKYNINRLRILNNGALFALLGNIYKAKSIGDECPDKKFLILRGGGELV